MEEKLLRSQKLKSLSVPANDFNYLLTAILGSISLAKFYCLDNTIYCWLEEAENATLLSGKEHRHSRFYFDEHDILVLSAPGALGRNEKPIFVDNF